MTGRRCTIPRPQAGTVEQPLPPSQLVPYSFAELSWGVPYRKGRISVQEEVCPIPGFRVQGIY